MSCPFCNINFSDISNTIIEETKNFYILPSKGALCDGYLLIIPKEHKNAMTELNGFQKEELLVLIKKYREKFFNIFKRHPIFFEHGSAGLDKSLSSCSISHAHLHIVNHNFLSEKEIINNVNLESVSCEEFLIHKKKNYISYISPNFKFYMSYNFKPTSQLMRIFIADDLNIPKNYNWKTSNFDNNILSTIDKFKNK